MRFSKCLVISVKKKITFFFLMYENIEKSKINNPLKNLLNHSAIKKLIEENVTFFLHKYQNIFIFISQLLTIYFLNKSLNQ